MPGGKPYNSFLSNFIIYAVSVAAKSKGLKLNDMCTKTSRIHYT
jgi:hypothetical protein